MQLFYTPNLTNELYDLSEEESKHCSQVLRLKTGDIIHCTDGEGRIFESEIIETNKKRTVINCKRLIRSFEKNKSPLHIAIAPVKNSDRFEWFLEKAVEIGIDEITPVICEHSERKTVNLERSSKIIISAMKQSLKAWLPKINPPVKFNDFVNFSKSDSKFIAYCELDDIALLKDVCNKNNAAVVLIGPEGDFSKNEFEYAVNKGFTPVSLGKSRLRTETAGVFVCSIFNMINQ